MSRSCYCGGELAASTRLCGSDNINQFFRKNQPESLGKRLSLSETAWLMLSGIETLNTKSKLNNDPLAGFIFCRYSRFHLPSARLTKTLISADETGRSNRTSSGNVFEVSVPLRNESRELFRTNRFACRQRT